MLWFLARLWGRRKSYKSAYDKLKQDDFSTNPKTKSNPGAPRFLTWFSGAPGPREYLPPPRILAAAANT
jgi:hypothetical protein